MTNPTVNTTNHSIVNTSTNQGAGDNPIHHEWLWFTLEGCSGCSLGPAQMGMSVNHSHHASGASSNALMDPAVELLRCTNRV